jgi:hypothetical protein
VLHPSDFSEASLVGFAHALTAALISKRKLVRENPERMTLFVQLCIEGMARKCQLEYALIQFAQSSSG